MSVLNKRPRPRMLVETTETAGKAVVLADSFLNDRTASVGVRKLEACLGMGYLVFLQTRARTGSLHGIGL